MYYIADIMNSMNLLFQLETPIGLKKYEEGTLQRGDFYISFLCQSKIYIQYLMAVCDLAKGKRETIKETPPKRERGQEISGD